MNRKEELLNIIYEHESTLEELFNIKQEAEKLSLDEQDKSYIDDQINDYLNVIDKVEDLEKIKNIMTNYNFDTTYIDKLINRNKPLTIKIIKKLDQEDLEYIIYGKELTIDQRIISISEMKNYDFTSFDYETAYDYLYELLDEISDLKTLKKIYKKMKKYNLKTSYIKNLINNIEKDNKIDSALVIYSLINNLSKNNTSIKDNSLDYEPYQFEEEELEDDDYYFEDDKN